MRLVLRVSVLALIAATGAQFPAIAQTPPRVPQPRPQAAAASVLPGPTANAITSAITLADMGFGNGFRFANLAGRREIFLPLPQGADVMATDLMLSIDDVSAHESRRSLEIMVNDRSLTSVALDGRGSARSIRVPLANARARDGYLKLTFLYSGAATQDRCIDVRYVGDSITIRPETSVALAIVFTGAPDVATTAALMPAEVAIVLPRRKLGPTEFATALTLSRAFGAAGRQTTFHHGFEAVPELTKRADAKVWNRGIVLVGTLEEASSFLDTPIASVAGAVPAFGAIVAARIGGLPALVVSDASSVRAGRLIGQPSVAATRGMTAASVGAVGTTTLPVGQVTFDQLGLVPAQAEVFGRADLPVVIDTRLLPADTRPKRLMLDIMVAPDGNGEKAVVSAFVNERLLGSTVAATAEPTRLDLELPEGLIGTLADIRAVVQRRSAQGDCRFEPQGYPAQILGSSLLTLETAPSRAVDFSDLVPRWRNGIEVMLPPTATDEPLPSLRLVSRVLDALAAESAPITVKLAGSGASPTGPFLAVGDTPPGSATPRVRFDRGRMAVADRSGKVLLDLGGFSGGAVAQIVNVGDIPGLWIKGLGNGSALPAPVLLKLDRGDVAFVDQAGVALAMSTERDTLVRVTYPDQVSWLTVADRFRSWIIGALWILASIGFLYGLQRMLRRRPPTATE